MHESFCPGVDSWGVDDLLMGNNSLALQSIDRTSLRDLIDIV